MTSEQIFDEGSRVARPSDPLAAAAAAAAPSARIAVAGRAFGDDYPALEKPWRHRAAGVLLMALTAFSVPWMLQNLNGSIVWFAWLFAATNLFSVGYSLLAIVNGWQRRVPMPRLTLLGKEPQVAVVIPTCGEPVAMVLRTVVSVFEQDWPRDRLTVVVSDDGHDAELAAALAGLPVLYYEPPPLWAPGRDGAAKAGNLTAAVAMLDVVHPAWNLVEDVQSGVEALSRGWRGMYVPILGRSASTRPRTFRATTSSAGRGRSTRLAS